MVVMVACTPLVEWSSWWARVTNEPGVLSQRSTTPAFGQGSYAVLVECDPEASVGQIVEPVKMGKIKQAKKFSDMMFRKSRPESNLTYHKLCDV